ncbi:MAG: Tryptophan synthase alpha chain [Labilithrix sp.]|nr:Tryptophan synthase alpha chain [Labilithrix sp.]
MQRRIVGFTSVFAVASILVQACTSQTYLGRGLDADAGAQPPSFTGSPDGGDEVNLPGTPVADMCPSDKCKAPLATCSTSQFLCDVDLSTDPENCGSCGNKCPTDDWRNPEFHAKWICVGGACQMSCSSTFWEDCNGRLEDGCETQMETRQNCGTCGHACPENAICNSGACEGCKSDEDYCFGLCTHLESDDYNCGTCRTFCDSQPPDKDPAPTNMYYGCANSMCGNLKCSYPWANCDLKVENGCEVLVINDPEHCGDCNTKCAAGEICVDGKCECTRGPSGCDCLPDFEADLMNCGACGVRCDEHPNAMPTCRFGRCGSRCKIGYGDCNLDLSDGCEINLSKDPQHCGSCEAACATGQACVDGVCAVEPCPPGVTH